MWRSKKENGFHIDIVAKNIFIESVFVTIATSLYGYNQMKGQDLTTTDAHE